MDSTAGLWARTVDMFNIGQRAAVAGAFKLAGYEGFADAISGLKHPALP